MFVLAAIVCLAVAPAQSPEVLDAIELTTEVAAPLDSVWNVWTTEHGVTSFFARGAHIVLRMGGPYEIFFHPEAPVGQRGGEGLRVLSYVPRQMVSFEWNAEPELKRVNQHRTFVVVTMDSIGPGRTRVTLSHRGWYWDSADWRQAHAFFEKGWPMVLRNLRHRFDVGPIDWSDPKQNYSE
jgi:uncharacterized protein YndB with AHSA1/START domain